MTTPLDLIPQQSIDPAEAFRIVATRWYDAHGDRAALAAAAPILAAQYGWATHDVERELWVSYGIASAEQRHAERESELLRRMAELRGLHRIIAAANSTLDLDTSMQQVVDTVIEVGAVDVCSIYLYDRDANELVLRACAGIDQSLIGQLRTTLGEGVIGAAGQAGKPIMVEDMHRDARGMRDVSVRVAELRGMLAVPIVLFSDGRFHLGTPRLQGVVTVHTRQPRSFSQSEVSFVETVAGELAFFITNAQIYQNADNQLHRKIRELTTLQQVSKRIAEQLRIDDLLQLIADKAVELSQAARADIFRYDANGTLVLAATHGAPLQPSPIPQCITTAVRDGRPLAILNAFADTRFPDIAETAARDGFFSLYCTPLHVRGEKPLGAISLYMAHEHYYDFEQVRLLSSFADAAAIAIENARLYDDSQRALAVKSVMLQEMHHRVRNNLQTISALLTMQLRRLPAESEANHALRDSVARIQAISSVHNLLSREDIGVTTVRAIVQQIVDHAVVSMTDPAHTVQFAVTGDPISVASRQATVLSIVLNELIMNALSHGLSAVGGQVVIEMRHDSHAYCIDVRDDGPARTVGLPPHRGTGMGQQMVRTLVESDLNGEFSFSIEHGWAVARVRFAPQDNEEEHAL
ncbi:MAG: hypothetical protein RLZZ297_963 [Chloroflexota bacterium]